MQFIKGNNCHQTYFITLDDQVSADNAVGLIDAFMINWNCSLLPEPKKRIKKCDKKSESKIAQVNIQPLNQ
jgi:hypothetical protein